MFSAPRWGAENIHHLPYKVNNQQEFNILHKKNNAIPHH